MVPKWEAYKGIYFFIGILETKMGWSAQMPPHIILKIVVNSKIILKFEKKAFH